MNSSSPRRRSLESSAARCPASSIVSLLRVFSCVAEQGADGERFVIAKPLVLLGERAFLASRFAGSHKCRRKDPTGLPVFAVELRDSLGESLLGAGGDHRR